MRNWIDNWSYQTQWETELIIEAIRHNEKLNWHNEKLNWIQTQWSIIKLSAIRHNEKLNWNNWSYQTQWETELIIEFRHNNWSYQTQWETELIIEAIRHNEKLNW